MTEAGRTSRPIALAAVLVLWSLGAVAVAVGAWTDRAARSTGPEAPVTAYFGSVERGDLNGALARLAPELRERSRAFVEWQLGNRYAILESAVRGDSLMDRLAGWAGGATSVVVTMEIEGKGNPRWRTTEEFPVRRADGQWLLAKTPLELP